MAAVTAAVLGALSPAAVSAEPAPVTPCVSVAGGTAIHYTSDAGWFSIPQPLDKATPDTAAHHGSPPGRAGRPAPGPAVERMVIDPAATRVESTTQAVLRHRQATADHPAQGKIRLHDDIGNYIDNVTVHIDGGTLAMFGDHHFQNGPGHHWYSTTQTRFAVGEIKKDGPAPVFTGDHPEQTVTYLVKPVSWQAPDGDSKGYNKARYLTLTLTTGTCSNGTGNTGDHPGSTDRDTTGGTGDQASGSSRRAAAVSPLAVVAVLAAGTGLLAALAGALAP
ncbi:hypothetical protein ACFSSC_05530 [Corynebacterium mendelii]|uniref:hypothetical protein n=1 Tax=Corynebacterium mendelii TaxID=2765362 RepID=UPI001A92F6A6|nr:hypothetical protein [Corynebacterium mendelii]